MKWSLHHHAKTREVAFNMVQGMSGGKFDLSNLLRPSTLVFAAKQFVMKSVSSICPPCIHAWMYQHHMTSK